jgi:hypothetical protein
LADKEGDRREENKNPQRDVFEISRCGPDSARILTDHYCVDDPLELFSDLGRKRRGGGAYTAKLIAAIEIVSTVKGHIFRRIASLFGLKEERYPQLRGVKFHRAAAYSLYAGIGPDLLIILKKIAAFDLPTDSDILDIIQTLSY